ncbi:hypothetical protein BJX64DRAFT_135750 [Aspergillus heterothallicus]
MTRICSSPARLSLPNVLRTLLHAPGTPQLLMPATRPSNRLSLSRRSVRNMITIGDIPITTSTEPQTSKPAENDHFPVNGSPSASNDKPPQDASTTAKPRSSPREKSETKKHIAGSKADRKGTSYNKKTEKGDNKRRPLTTAPPFQKKKLEDWEIQKEALKKKFPTGWSPQKKVSPDAMEGIRHLHAVSPEKFTTSVLAEEFKVSPEAVRRILKSKWRPNAAELEDRRKRWEKRHDRIWGHLSELGLRPHTARTAHLGDAHKVLYGDKNKP